MATVVETITFANQEDALREHLGIAAPAQETLLKRLLEVATRAADHFIGNTFKVLDEETGEETGVDIVWFGTQKHAGIELGVYEWVRIYLELSAQSVGSVIAAGAKSIKTDDLSATYGNAAAVGGSVGFAGAASDAVRELWRPSRFPRTGGKVVWY